MAKKRPATSPHPNNILAQAAQVVYGQNDKTYGTPKDNFDRIARMWSALASKKLHQDVTLDALDVAKFLIAVKLARLVETPDHLDSWLDIAGYAACGERVLKQL